MNTDRFKFRVWKPDWKQYDNDNYLSQNGVLVYAEVDGDGYSGLFCDGYDGVIEQCTGLKDKNGRLIYEGDVIRVFNACDECDHNKDSDTGIGSVIWLESHGIFYVTGMDSPENSIYDLNFNDYHFEVIGNIHEEKWGIEK